MKYVISTHNEVIIFPDYLNHSDMARRLEYPPAAAGKVYYNEGDIICSGSSYTLSLESRGAEDAEIVKRALDYYN